MFSSLLQFLKLYLPRIIAVFCAWICVYYSVSANFPRISTSRLQNSRELETGREPKNTQQRNLSSSRVYVPLREDLGKDNLSTDLKYETSRQSVLLKRLMLIFTELLSFTFSLQDEPFIFEQGILHRIAGGLKLEFHASFTQTLQKTSGSALLSKWYRASNRGCWGWQAKQIVMMFNKAALPRFYIIMLEMMDTTSTWPKKFHSLRMRSVSKPDWPFHANTMSTTGSKNKRVVGTKLSRYSHLDFIVF